MPGYPIWARSMCLLPAACVFTGVHLEHVGNSTTGLPVDLSLDLWIVCCNDRLLRVSCRWIPQEARILETRVQWQNLFISDVSADGRVQITNNLPCRGLALSIVRSDGEGRTQTESLQNCKTGGSIDRCVRRHQALLCCYLAAVVTTTSRTQQQQAIPHIILSSGRHRL